MPTDKVNFSAYDIEVCEYPCQMDSRSCGVFVALVGDYSIIVVYDLIIIIYHLL